MGRCNHGPVEEHCVLDFGGAPPFGTEDLQKLGERLPCQDDGEGGVLYVQFLNLFLGLLKDNLVELIKALFQEEGKTR